MHDFKIRRRAPRSAAAILKNFHTGYTKAERRDLTGFSTLLSVHHKLAPLGQLIDSLRPPLANWPRYGSGLGLRVEDGVLTLMVAHRIQEARLRQTMPSLQAAIQEAGYDIHTIETALVAQDGALLENPDTLPVARLKAEEVLAKTQHIKPTPRLSAAARIWGHVHTLTHPETQGAMRELAMAMTPPGVTERDLTREYLTGEVQLVLEKLASLKTQKAALDKKLEGYPLLNYDALPANHPAHLSREKTLSMRQHLLTELDSLNQQRDALMKALTFLTDWLGTTDEELSHLTWETIAIHTSVAHTDLVPYDTRPPSNVELPLSEGAHHLRDEIPRITHAPLRHELEALAYAMESQASPTPEPLVTVEALLVRVKKQLEDPHLEEGLRAILLSVLDSPIHTHQEATDIALWLHEMEKEALARQKHTP